MEYIFKAIPYEYSKNIRLLTWQDVLFAIKSGILEESAAIEHAKEEFQKLEEYSDEIYSLMTRTHTVNIVQDIEDITKDLEKIDEEILKHRWRNIILSWLFDNKDQFEDVIYIIDGIFADFGYPDDMMHITSFMSANCPEYRALKDNEDEVCKRWSDYFEVVYSE